MMKQAMWLCLAAAPVIVVSCEVSFTTAKLSEATMCRSVDPQTKAPVDKTDVFSTDTPEIFCSVKLSNAPESKVTAKWIYVEGAAEDLKNHQIDEYSLTTQGTGYISFSLTKPDKGFPKGTYLVKLLLDDKEKLSVPFTVE